MLIKGINFPDELVSASRDGTLVIFSGAGVSRPSPSNYPDFKGLAKELARGQALKRRQLDIDRFLGQLEDHGVLVHRLVKEMLSNPNSKPNPLHYNLLKIFQSGQSIRLITTNFDTHFSSAAKDLFGQTPTFSAPVLPPGRNFEGICYLHGCVSGDPMNLVLTDRDFGRAYVVDGWAAKFLQEIFRQFTVVFVGYSHTDPIVYHMARGLPSDTSSRYSLIPEGEEEHWQSLGIIPICYRWKGSRKHAMLMEAIAAWEECVPRPTVKHQGKVKEIVSGSPTADPEENDYLYEVLRNPETAHFFTKCAARVDWLEWVEKKGLLGPLLGLGALEEPSYIIANWFADKFVIDDPKEAISIVQRNKGLLHPYLWNRIVQRLGSQKHAPGADTLNTWLPVLLAHDHPHYSDEDLEHVLTRCTGPEYALSALMLFRRLTKPKMVLKEDLDFGAFDGKKFATIFVYEVTIPGEHWLRKAWHKFFKPELPSISASIAAIITANLQEAQEILRLLGQTHGDWDRLSGWREAIDGHEQDQYLTRPIDIFIDIARDLIEWLLVHRHDEASRVITTWCEGETPVLKRLAIHAICVDSASSGDQKLRWLLKKGWLYSGPFRHEVFRLIKTAYPICEESARNDLLEAVLQGPGEEGPENLADGAAYLVCELLELITTADPNCCKAANAFLKAKELCPDFIAHEGLNLAMNARPTLTAEKAPMELKELLATEPRLILDYLLTFAEDNIHDPSREALLGIISQAIAESFDWGMQLCLGLQDRGLWQTDLWMPILRAWTASKLSEAQLIQVFSLINHTNFLQSFGHYVEELLFEKTRSTDLESRYLWLPYAERLVRHLWIVQVMQSDSDPPEDHEAPDFDDWTFVALNEPGGRIVWSLMYMLSTRRREAGKDWAGIPEDYKNFMDQILSDTSRPTELGRVFLAWNIPFLIHIDTNWTCSSLLPMLDWSKDQRIAEQAWHGFLGMGRLSHQLLTELRPLYESTFPYVSSRLGYFKDGFIRQIAESCFMCDFDPLEDNWLPSFLSKLEEEDRPRWAWWVRRLLEGSDETKKARVWNHWIAAYWDNRNRGKPLPLSDLEKEQMLQWALELDLVFPDAVKKIFETPAPIIRNQRFYNTFSEKQLTSRFPDEAAQLLMFTMRKALTPFFACEEVAELVRQLGKYEKYRETLVEVCDQMARLECEKASELRAELPVK